MEPEPQTKTYPSLRQLAEQLAELKEYAPLRTYIRGTVSMALGEPRKVIKRKEELTDQECIIHSLIADWLDAQGYYIPAQLMRTQMAKNYIENSENFLEFEKEDIDFLMKKHLKTKMPLKLKRDEKPVENGHKFSNKISNPAEFKREPIKIAPISDEKMREIYRQQMQVQRARLARRNQLVVQTAQVVDSDSDDSSSDSDGSTSSSSSTPEAEEENSEKEEKVTFADIMKKSLSFDEEDSKILESNAAWGPSKLGLVTDEAPPTSIFASSAHLPPLPAATARRASLESKDSEDIDALLEGLDDLDVSDDGEKTPTNSTLETEEKPVVAPLAPQMELLSDESIDELEDFDTGALSSAGSDYSF